MKMIKVEELHKEANGNSYTRNTYTVGRYEACIDDAAYADGRTRRSISVTEPYESGCYLPKIYYNEDVFGEKTPDFSIQTTSYGALNSEEFQKFIADQNEALAYYGSSYDYLITALKLWSDEAAELKIFVDNKFTVMADLNRALAASRN